MGLLTAKDKAEMAERAEKNRKTRLEQARQAIEVERIVKMLQDHALGKGRMKMTPARLKAAEMLLNKALPDLATEKATIEAKQVVFNLTTVYAGTKPPLPPAEVVDG